ncbi:hypothetical protein Tco_0289192, partial [Tanacetum coccineum]
MDTEVLELLRIIWEDIVKKPKNRPKDKPRFNEGAKRLFIKKQHHREIILKLDPSDHVSTSVMIRNIPN